MRFLVENEGWFRGSLQLRREARIYVHMSSAVSTRSPDQCRSHHQKMIKYHGSIPGIIQHIQGQSEAGKAASESVEEIGEEEDLQLLECIYWVEAQH